MPRSQADLVVGGVEKAAVEAVLAHKGLKGEVLPRMYGNQALEIFQVTAADGVVWETVMPRKWRQHLKRSVSVLYDRAKTAGIAK